MLIEADAYVLRVTRYGERDLIVELFIEGIGKLSAIARSARASKRRFPGGIEPFSKMRIRAKAKVNRSLAFLEETNIQNGHAKIRESYDKITIASYITELTSVFVQPGEAADIIFGKFERFFTNLEAINEPDLPRLVLQYELSLTQDAGYAPSLDACFKCGSHRSTFDKFRMSRQGEGLLCGECIEGERYGIAERETMQVFWDEYNTSLKPTHFSQARRIVWASLGPVVDRELKTRSLVEALWT